MIAWPHAGTDWAYMLPKVSECYVKLAEAIVTDNGLRLLVVTPEPDTVRKALEHLPQDKLILFTCPTNDTWTRDYGPVTIETPDGPTAIDFQFNGWGLKFAANLDNMVNLRMLHASLLTRRYRQRLNFVFEGGSMESDGKGTMLSTANCLMSLNRNGFTDEAALQHYFKTTLGFNRLLLLHHGALEGDDTDSHIDTLARFAPGDTIVYVKSYRPDDSHTPELELMEQELMQLRTAEGHPYNLLALPLPDPIFDHEGHRLPATYANFLITPTTVLMPTYAQPANDTLAEQMLRVAFHDRRIVTVDCRALIEQHGSLHCATMQLPDDLINV